MEKLKDNEDSGKSVFIKKEFVIGFFIGIFLYLFIFGIRVVKVLIKSRGRFDMIQIGLFKTFSDPAFALMQVFILVLCVVGSITLYSLYRGSHFFQK